MEGLYVRLTAEVLSSHSAPDARELFGAIDADGASRRGPSAIPHRQFRFVPYRDSPYKQEWARLNGSATLVLGDQTIDRGEMEAALDRLGIPASSRDQANSVFSVVDADHDGRLTRGNFEAALQLLPEGAAEVAMQRLMPQGVANSEDSAVDPAVLLAEINAYLSGGPKPARLAKYMKEELELLLPLLAQAVRDSPGPSAAAPPQGLLAPLWVSARAIHFRTEICGLATHYTHTYITAPFGVARRRGCWWRCRCTCRPGRRLGRRCWCRTRGWTTARWCRRALRRGSSSSWSSSSPRHCRRWWWRRPGAFLPGLVLLSFEGLCGGLCGRLR